MIKFFFPIIEWLINIQHDWKDDLYINAKNDGLL